MTEEKVGAAVDLISAVDAGVLQSLNKRIKQRQTKPAQRFRANLDYKACNKRNTPGITAPVERFTSVVAKSFSLHKRAGSSPNLIRRRRLLTTNRGKSRVFPISLAKTYLLYYIARRYKSRLPEVYGSETQEWLNHPVTISARCPSKLPISMRSSPC